MDKLWNIVVLVYCAALEFDFEQANWKRHTLWT